MSNADSNQLDNARVIQLHHNLGFLHETLSPTRKILVVQRFYRNVHLEYAHWSVSERQNFELWGKTC